MITKKCDIVNEKIENDNQNHRCDVCFKTFSKKHPLGRYVGDGCKSLKYLQNVNYLQHVKRENELRELELSRT